MLVLATGGGKTNIAADMIAGALAKGKRVLFLAHRRELITQAAERLLEFGITAGIVMADRRELSAAVVVASVSTLVNLLDVIADFDLVIVDEAHHFILGKLADDLAREFASEVEKKPKRKGMYRRVFDRFAEVAHFIGLTATPERLDGGVLGDVFEAMVVPEVDGQLVDLVWLQENGFLVPARYFAGRKKIDTEGLTPGEKSGEFNANAVFERANDKELFADVVEHYEKRAAGMQAVCFNVNVKHSLAMTAEFEAAGIAAAHLDGNTPEGERDRIVADFKARRIQVLNNVGIISEGVDIPGIECVIMNRPTASLVVWLQSIGRALRPVYLPGMPLETADERLASIYWSDKPTAIVLDHGGNCKRLGFAEDKRQYTLKGRRKKKGRPAVTECPEAFGGCGRLLPGGPLKCPQCGFELREYVDTPDEPSGKKTVKGELVEVTPELLQKAGADMTFAELERVRAHYKRQIGWVTHQLRHQAKMTFLKRKHEGDVTADEVAIFAALLQGFSEFKSLKPGFVRYTLAQHGLVLAS